MQEKGTSKLLKISDNFLFLLKKTQTTKCNITILSPETYLASLDKHQTICFVSFTQDHSCNNRTLYSMKWGQVWVHNVSIDGSKYVYTQHVQALPYLNLTPKISLHLCDGLKCCSKSSTHLKLSLNSRLSWNLVPLFGHLSLFPCCDWRTNPHERKWLDPFHSMLEYLSIYKGVIWLSNQTPSHNCENKYVIFINTWIALSWTIFFIL